MGCSDYTGTRCSPSLDFPDYGVMITPWNHFHLCWLALRLGDNESAMAHALALSKIASNWTIFKPLRSNPELNDQLLKLKNHFHRSSEKSSLQNMWFDKAPMHLINVRIREIWVYAINSENGV